MEEMILRGVSQFGFPAVVCFYTLFCVNKSMKDLTTAINKLTNDIDKRESEQTNKIETLEVQINELKFRVEAICRERN